MAEATPTSKFTAPTPGLEDVHFTQGNRKVVAKFGIVRIKLTIHIGSKDKGIGV